MQNGLANGTYSSIILPTWDDPGDAIRQNAISEFNQARAELDNAAHVCAGEVRAGCADAPEEPAWWESGLKFVGGIFQGAGEAIWDIATMLPFSPANLIQDAWKLTTGDLALEELQKTYELDLETVQGMWNALQDDPVEFGKNLGKGLLDWDTWADDPARALGHLVPDAVVAVATAGTGTAATRGAGSIDDLVDGMRAIDRMEDAASLRHLDDLGDLDRLDDLGDLNRLDNLPDDLRDLVNTPVGELTPSQIHDLIEARNAVTVEPGTPMQRVISQDDAADYLRGNSDSNPYFRSNETFGFTARQEDVVNLRTSQDMFDGLGLDYDNTPFRSAGDLLGPNQGGTAIDEIHYLRYEQGADGAVVPRDSSLGGDGSFDGAARDPDNPFTGNGYTKGGVPEFRTDGPNQLSPGSELWRADASGHQHLVAILDESGQWVPR